MRKFVYRGVIMFVIFGACFVVPQLFVSRASSNIVQLEDVPEVDAVIVLGASVLRDGTPSDILEDRLLTAVDVYSTGKASAILVSGDDGQEAYDEVNAMRLYLLGQGVPAEDIFLDHAGFDTYDSMYRAQAIFGIERVVISTQAYHLPRALYIGEAMGIDVSGVAADRQAYRGMRSFMARELLANVKA
ncbi:MAG: YdcF family protein, partial [Candidatus Uhrbacteria bacterium]|nr:YdcF family protein [Candidatus Uhrbacteria bacterium]